MKLISTNLNAYNEGLTEAIENKDTQKIQAIVKKVEEAGADYIEVNAPHGDKEQELLEWMIDTVQEATDIPLVLGVDKVPDPAAAVKKVKHPGIINGMCTPETAARILPVFDEIDEEWLLIINVLDEDKDAGQRMEAYVPLFRQAGIHGIVPERIIIDPCADSLVQYPNSYLNVEELIDAFENVYPTASYVVEPFMISDKIAKPEPIKLGFMALAMGMGIEYMKLDVTDAEMRRTYYALLALLNEEGGLAAYEKQADLVID